MTLFMLAHPTVEEAPQQESAQQTGIRGPIEVHELFSMALDGLHMAYQPIVCAKTGRVFGYEALLRTPEMRPDELVNLADNLDRLPEVIGEVSRQTAETWRANEDRGTLFVNLHPKDLGHDLLVGPNSPFAGVEHRVVLELTEVASIDDVPNARERLAQLRSMGFRVAIDDLGCGYSSLSTVASLVPDVIKLDRSLISGIDTNPIKRSLVGALVSFAQSSNIQLLGEGVETQAECDVLVELGIDLLQGYWFARPGPAFPRVNR